MYPISKKVPIKLPVPLVLSAIFALSVDLSILYVIVTHIYCSFEHYLFYIRKLVIYKDGVSVDFIASPDFTWLDFNFLPLKCNHNCRGTNVSKMQPIYAALTCHKLGLILVMKIGLSVLEINLLSTYKFLLLLHKLVFWSQYLATPWVLLYAFYSTT